MDVTQGMPRHDAGGSDLVVAELRVVAARRRGGGPCPASRHVVVRPTSGGGARGTRPSATHGLIDPLEALVFSAISGIVRPSARSRRHSRRTSSVGCERYVAAGRGIPLHRRSSVLSSTGPMMTRISL